MQALRDFDKVGAKRTGPHAGGQPQKYFLEDPGRRLILAVYGDPDYGSLTESINYLSNALKVPRHVVKKWGRQLGLSRSREPQYTEEEVAYLEENAGTIGIAAMAKRLGRTQTAIRVKCKRLRVSRNTVDGYNAQSLAVVLGCDVHKVLRWIKDKKLRARYVKSSDCYYIKRSSARDFIARYPQEIVPRRADWLALHSLLFNESDIQKSPRKQREMFLYDEISEREVDIRDYQHAPSEQPIDEYRQSGSIYGDSTQGFAQWFWEKREIRFLRERADRMEKKIAKLEQETHSYKNMLREGLT